MRSSALCTGLDIFGDAAAKLLTLASIHTAWRRVDAYLERATGVHGAAVL